MVNYTFYLRWILTYVDVKCIYLRFHKYLLLRNWFLNFRAMTLEANLPQKYSRRLFSAFESFSDLTIFFGMIWWGLFYHFLVIKLIFDVLLISINELYRKSRISKVVFSKFEKFESFFVQHKNTHELDSKGTICLNRYLNLKTFNIKTICCR